ncbi:TIGR00270 family protein [Candidatus Woesearchaeota archaeon CG10_big_fil_rev_8_21_14_0_10_36_11]|nr:MAG: TIGR00270 family protein [Candidatus Woesearchaeota archaeon CG10_big_fil_rev_8_21_14_0_10_36_11]
MPVCEMCGREGDILKAEVEGVELNVCFGCSKYGSVKKRGYASISRSFEKHSSKEEPSFQVVHNFASLLRSYRERNSMTQEDFAKFLNERESVVAKWESGSLKPRIDTARVLERKLNIRFVEMDTETKQVDTKKKVSHEFTLGDFIKVRKRE